MLEKIKKIFKKDQTEFDDNTDFDVDKKLNKKVLFKVKKKNEDDNEDLGETVNFDDDSDFDLDKKLNKKAESKDKKKAKDDNVSLDDNADFDVDKKLNKKSESKGKKKTKDDNAESLDGKDDDFSLEKPSKKTSKKKPFKFKKWMIIPIVFILMIVIPVVVFIIKNNAHKHDVNQVAISSLPTKLVYYVGEQPSYTGLAITTTYNDGTSITEGPEACTFSGFNSEFPEEEQLITVTYGEHTFVYTITIKEMVRPFSPLEKISLESLPKTEYKVGDWLNVNDGVLIVEYEDGTTRRIRLEHNHIYNFSTESPGEFTITVKYVEDGYLATCTYDITVTE